MKNLTLYPRQYFFEESSHLEKQEVQKWFNSLDEDLICATSFEQQKKLVLKWNEIRCHIETHFEKSSLAFHQYTQDKKIEEEHERLQNEVEPVYKERNAKIRKAVLASHFKEDLEKEFSKKYFQELDLAQQSFDERLIPLEQKIQESLNEYTKLSGSGTFCVQGQSYPLAHYRVFADNPSEAIRKEALEAYQAWFCREQEKLEGYFQQAMDLRQSSAKILGHSDYIPLAYQKMRRFDYGPKEVQIFRKEIEKVLVPICKKIRTMQASCLGQSTVSAWDMEFFPNLRVQKQKLKVEEQVPAVLAVFQKISPKLSKHFQSMIDHDLIDPYAREGKAPGAFCTDFADYRVPFIYANSVGEASDITTLLHEAGHAFQAWESRQIDLLDLRWPGLEACEVHSMSMEFLAYPHFDIFFENEDAIRYRVMHLIENLLILPYIAVVDEFQHEVYGSHLNSPQLRAKCWKDLEQKYLPGIDYGHLEAWQEKRWLRQLHIFHNPFYYIDYAIALVGALQIWMQSLKNPDQAIENYTKLCTLGGTKSLVDFFKEGSLTLPFKEGFLEELIQQVLATQAWFTKL